MTYTHNGDVEHQCLCDGKAHVHYTVYWRRHVTMLMHRYATEASVQLAECNIYHFMGTVQTEPTTSVWMLTDWSYKIINAFKKFVIGGGDYVSDMLEKV